MKGHSDGCEVTSYCGVDLHFLMTTNVEHLFMLLLVCLLWENSIEVFCPFFNRVVWGFLMLSCMSCLYMLDINPSWVISFATI